MFMSYKSNTGNILMPVLYNAVNQSNLMTNMLAKEQAKRYH